MAVPESQEKLRLYSPDGLDSDHDSDSQSDNGFPQYARRPRRGLLRRSILVAISLSLFALSLLGAFSMGVLMAGKPHGTGTRAYSPAAGVLTPTTRVFDEGHNPYMGKPSPELDGAWTKLLQYSNLRFTEAEVDAIDPQRKYFSSVKLPDGGYMGMLHAYHELHCIKHLRRFLYADYYTPDLKLTQQQSEDRRWHSEHCLDALRQGVMCRADVTPRTMRWIQTAPVPGANSSNPHNCYNWDAVDEWAKTRSIDNIFEKGYLKHPTLGDVYSWDGIEDLKIVAVGHEASENH